MSSSNTAKEITPVVSANCDAEEVILSNKQQKDRESPIKGRKQTKEQQQVHQVKDLTIGANVVVGAVAAPVQQQQLNVPLTAGTNKDISDKQQTASIIVKDDIKSQNKEISSSTSATVAATAATTNTTVGVTCTPHKDSNKECVDNKRSHKSKDNKNDSKVPNVETSDSCANVTAPITGQTNLNAQDNSGKLKFRDF